MKQNLINYLSKNGKKIFDNLKNNLWEQHDFDYKKHGLSIINEYINLELICLESSKYKYLFDTKELKNAILNEDIVNKFYEKIKKEKLKNQNLQINLSLKIIEIISKMYNKLLEKLEYLLEETTNKYKCKYCGIKIRKKNKYGNICIKHIPSYALFDEDENENENNYNIYQEYTEDELRYLEYKESTYKGYEDELYEM